MTSGGDAHGDGGVLQRREMVGDGAGRRRKMRRTATAAASATSAAAAATGSGESTDHRFLEEGMKLIRGVGLFN